MAQETGQSKFAWTCLIIQIVFGILYVLMVRYADSADAKHVANQLGTDHELEENLQKYPAVLDIHMMLIGGFGFLMTFLKRYGFSALGLTMMVVVFVTEWSILLWGFTKMDASFTIHLTMLDILEAGLTSAAVLISLGVMLGKLNPFQVLVMALLEAAFFTANAYIGYTLLGAVDIGGAIFIHTFGAYFGIAMAMTHRGRNFSLSEKLEESRYTSDLFAMLGTVLLWIFWPSFNAILADHDAYHRAIMNTYLSLLGSTVATFIVSSLFGGGKRFDIVDLQNASLSGGVAVGAIADLMIQPYGAFFAGTCTGAISALGYRLLQGKLFDKIRLHDTCGVNNLHGMPGIISGVLSVIVCYLATQDIYGPSLYLLFPKSAPEADSSELLQVQGELPGLIEAGEGRSMSTQALMQLAALAITIGLSIVSGAITGIILNVSSLFEGLSDYQLFDDSYFWSLPKEGPDHDNAEERQMTTFAVINEDSGQAVVKRTQVDPEPEKNET